MNIKSILSEKGGQIITIGEECSLGDVAGLLAEKNIGALVVHADDNPIAGIISERDIVKLIGQKGSSVLDEPVSGHMTKNVIVCDEFTTIDKALEMMTMKRCRHLPVVDDKKLIGFISIGDVVKKKIESVEKEADEMRSYIYTA